MHINKRKAAMDTRRTATPETLQYIQSLIAYKRTHIQREQDRLDNLERMESELLAIVK